MEPTELAWRVEAACMNAWPAPRQLLLDGWLLRAAGGGIRRTNSVNPLRSCRGNPRAVLSTAEAVYAALGQPAIFRVPSLVGGMDAVLAAAGYTAEGHTLTLFADLGPAQPSQQGAAVLTADSGEAWLSARARLGGVDPQEQRRFATMLESILLPKAFAAVSDDGEIAALAYAVVCDCLAVIEAVITDPAKRRRGFARQVVGRLLDWARESGAEGACLQVVADNAPALALYRSLGFGRELYRYHYRRKTVAGG